MQLGEVAVHHGVDRACNTDEISMIGATEKKPNERTKQKTKVKSKLELTGDQPLEDTNKHD